MPAPIYVSMKNILICLAALLITAETQAQATDGQVAKTRFFFKLYGNYGLITPGSDRVTARIHPNGGDEQFSVGNRGLGAGLHCGGGVGLVASDFLNLGIDVDYLKGNKLQTNEISDGGGQYYTFSRNTTNYSILSVIPNVTFKALSKPAYFMYTRIGIILTTKIKYATGELDSADYPSTATRITEQDNVDYSFKLNAGVQIAFGAQFTLVKNLRGFVELTGNYLPISPSSSVDNGEIREYNPDNSIKTRTKADAVTTTYSKTGTYVNSGTHISSPSIVYNVNSIGVGVGLVYKF